jgi:hypothetical protein
VYTILKFDRYTRSLQLRKWKHVILDFSHIPLGNQFCMDLVTSLSKSLSSTREKSLGTRLDCSFKIIGVNEIGLRSLLTIRTGFCFGRGFTSAIFQEEGNRFSWQDEFRILHTSRAKILAFSLNTQSGSCSVTTSA